MTTFQFNIHQPLMEKKAKDGVKDCPSLLNPYPQLLDCVLSRKSKTLSTTRSYQEEVAKAHAYVAENPSFGKVVLTV